MNEMSLRIYVEHILVNEMGYSPAAADRMAGRHGDRIRDALIYLPRRLAMQIELLEVKRAERLD